VFEGKDRDARQYFKWHIVNDRGMVTEVRNREPSFSMGMRYGKTARDAESGAPARRAVAAELRAAWNRTINERGGKRDAFPQEACNGRESQALKRVHKCGSAVGQPRGGMCHHKRSVSGGVSGGAIAKRGKTGG